MSFSDRYFSRLVPTLGILLIVGIVLLPVGSLLVSWTDIQYEIWQHLLETQLLSLALNTLLLLSGVVTGVTVLGTVLAALVAMCDFPGRRWLEWALILPFAVPAYVLAFIYLGIFDFSGPLQGLLRDVVPGFTWVDIRHPAGVIAILVLVFYPYVYMLARAAFQRQSRSLGEAARLLGLNRRQAFFRVSLPMARPAIVGGAMLAAMETLADFGTVSVFNYDTFTTAIYKSWFGFFNLKAAAQLATFLLFFILMLFSLEPVLKGRGERADSERQPPQQRLRLNGWRAWLASGFCTLVVMLAFVFPLLQLGNWVLTQSWQDFDSRYLELVIHTLLLAGSAAVITVTAAVVLTLVRRFQPTVLSRFAEKVAALGYAMPGSLLAVAIMTLFGTLDGWLVSIQEALGFDPQPILLGSLAALLLAYMVRFLAVAHKPVSAALDRIKPSMHEVARSLGHKPVSVVRRVYLPLMTPGLLSALLLVFVDVLKEMPATMLMRPFGWDTLAVRIHEMTAEGEWERAALPALALIVAGLVPVILLMRKSGSD